MEVKLSDIEYASKLVASYLEAIGRVHKTGNLYRGHANAEWLLVPSAARSGVHGLKNAYQLAKWKVAAGRLVGRPQSDLEWLVLAQHYGIPTMLLDWTTNPLVALYFACQDVTRIDEYFKDASVVYISEAAFRTESDPFRIDVFIETVAQPLLVPSTIMNKRSLAQDSVMTLHNDYNANPAEGFNPIAFNIPSGLKKQILMVLKVLGVSSDRIYADINTVAREYADDLKDAAIRAMAFRPDH